MDALRTLSERLLDSGDDEGCGCESTFDEDRLRLDASDCDHGGRLEVSAECRETAITALTERDVDSVHVRTDGIERVYETDAAALLVAAGRFAETVAFHDERLATRARRDPLGAAREATGRADPTADIVAETGLAELATRADDYESALAPLVGLSMSDWRIDTSPPPAAELTDVRDIDTGGTVRVYDRVDSRGQYSLTPLDSEITSEEASVLANAYKRLATGLVDGGDRAPGRAVRQVLEAQSANQSETSDPGDVLTAGSESPSRLSRLLSKHTRGHGLLEDLFADPDVSDVFVTAPASTNPLYVRADGETVPTNVRLTEQGVEALAARYRRDSGRGFSRADPTLDTATTIAGRRVRVAGVTEPASDGIAFAFRAHDRTVWTLPKLVDNGTLTASAGALLSVAVERGASVLVAGPRGAGKTTLLGALLPELPPDVRTIVVEDAPELPVQQLQTHGRDVQALCASGEDGELSATESVRTALRLGDGALVVGEVRGEEAQSLYEAMRVGANSEAVLGTIHGDGGEDVYERVVEDLGVTPASFSATDLVVTLERTADGTRRVRRIEEVVDGTAGTFEPLYDRSSDQLAATGRLDRGNARVLQTLRRPSESYADVRSCLSARRDRLAERVRNGETDIENVAPTVAGAN